jgi:uncharacterized membrane protein YeaQ/YmgE (transglycosylase-associated protein family)
MRDPILWIGIGAVVGWIGNRLAGTHGRWRVAGDLLIGIGGAVPMALFLAPLAGQARGWGGFNLPALVGAAAGATFLIALSKLLYRK